jgi:hypothetical protein
VKTLILLLLLAQNPPDKCPDGLTAAFLSDIVRCVTLEEQIKADSVALAGAFQYVATQKKLRDWEREACYANRAHHASLWRFIHPDRCDQK